MRDHARTLQSEHRGHEGKNVSRSEWIDAVKGFGIILVVLGHLPYQSGSALHHVRNAVYLFHMPLFFFISGWTFRTKPMGVAARGRAGKILVPYASFLLLIVALDPIASALLGVPGYTSTSGVGATIAKLLLGGAALNTPLSAFWFLTCLFLTGLVCNGLYREDRAPFRSSNLVLLGVSLGLALLLSRLAGGGIMEGPIRLNPLGLFSVPAALVFFQFGIAAARNPKGTLPWLFAMCLGVRLLTPGAFDMKYVDTGNLSNFLLALSICALVTVMFRTAGRVINQPLAFLGQASLVIMALHVPIIHFSKGYLPVTVLFCLALFLPAVALVLMGKTRLTKRLFLGDRT